MLLSHSTGARTTQLRQILVVGDVRAREVERLVEATFGSWRGLARRGFGARPADAGRAGVSHIVTKTGSPQSELRLGHVGLPRTSRRLLPVTVMNALLGGLFSSRINLNLREAHGYTYGAHSGYDWRRWAGPFSGRRGGCGAMSPMRPCVRC